MFMEHMDLIFLVMHLTMFLPGISKDISCASDGEDISMCEGEDYIQLRFHDNHFGKYENPTLASFATFQNPQGSNKPHSADHLYNSYFNNNQTINGTEYCFTNSEIGDLNSTCVNSYDANLAQNGSHFTFIPLGSDSAQKNVLLPSDIKQSYRSGLGSEFMDEFR